MRTVERLPFTVYDVIGYLAPGVATLWFIAAVAKWAEFHTKLGVKAEHLFIFGNSTLDGIILGVIFLVAAYAMGYMVSYLSAAFVERLVVYDLGYPTGHLMSETEAARETYVKSQRARHGIIKRLIVYVVMWPAVPVHVFMLVTGWIYSELKALPSRTQDKVRLRYDDPEVGNEPLNQTKTDGWFRVVEAYVLNNFDGIDQRSYNYVVIYGFVRSFLFVSVIACWISASILICAFGYHLNPLNLESDSNGFALRVILYSGLISVSVLYGAYVKFFRRYSQEILNGFAMLSKPDKSA
ncbi:MAG: hypothetical protein JJ855_01090 [Rhodospirillales bacterium]|nr:hypothetical protein [Rhodospirillales bacterium]